MNLLTITAAYGFCWPSDLAIAGLSCLRTNYVALFGPTFGTSSTTVIDRWRQVILGFV